MKKVPIIAVLFFISLSAALYADVIKMKDGSVLNGKILRITGSTIEYDPDGNIPFDIINKDSAYSVVYSDGKVVDLRNESTPPAANAKQSDVRVDIKGAHTHDGFYFRFLYGPAYERVIISSPDKIEFRGSAAAVSFQFGYTIVPDFILFSSMNINVGPSHSVTDDQNIKNLKGYEYSSTMLGIGFSYYMMPENYYFSMIISRYYGDFNNEDASDEIFSTRGVALTFAFGKEWWLSDNWGLGVSFFYTYAHASTGRKYFGAKYGVNDYIYGLAFSATYN